MQPNSDRHRSRRRMLYKKFSKMRFLRIGYFEDIKSTFCYVAWKCVLMADNGQKKEILNKATTLRDTNCFYYFLSKTTFLDNIFSVLKMTNDDILSILTDLKMTNNQKLAAFLLLDRHSHQLILFAKYQTLCILKENTSK